MFADPVFAVLEEYKEAHKGDVIRFEMAIRAEIARIHQYQRQAFTEKNKKQLVGVENSIRDNLNAVLKLVPFYLNSAFNAEVKKTNWWDRRTLKANCLNWKYHFYVTEKATATKELTALLREKAKVTVKQVKESTR